VEALDAASLELKRQSPLYASLQSHNAAIRALNKRSRRLQDHIDELEGLLNDLETGYNPNYVDMAVINTVKAWREMKGEDVETPTDSAEPAQTEESTDSEVDDAAKAEEADVHEPSEEELEDERWSDSAVSDLTDRTDYVALMLDHERHVAQGAQGASGADAKSILFSVADYIPDEWIPAFEATKQHIVETLALFGFASKPVDTSAETTLARQAHNDATSTLSSRQKELEKEQQAADKLFDSKWYGKDGEWRQLDHTCLDTDTGEYTYTVCLFGSATQKSNKNSASNNLGTFSSWSTSPSVTPGDYEYYATQVYSHGAQCWNGPQRSVILHLSCGLENVLLSVTEPEKCEYHITGRTPALCLPLDEKERAKDEL